MTVTRMPLGPDLFRRLRDALAEYCGIWFADDATIQLERGIAPRVEALELAGADEYVDHVCFGAERRAELAELAERITTHETYFFREPEQLEGFVSAVVPELEAGVGKQRLTVWSAGCSTGEEAYSLAMLLCERRLASPAGSPELRVFGSDLSRKALATARAGLYGKGALRGIEPGQDLWHRRAKRFLEGSPDGAGKLRVRDEVRALCDFGQVNLVDDATLGPIGEVEVVFCRNVLMYFEKAQRRRAFEALARKLVAGGVLYVGAAESALMGEVPDLFERRDLPSGPVFRRRGRSNVDQAV